MHSHTITYAMYCYICMIKYQWLLFVLVTVQVGMAVHKFHDERCLQYSPTEKMCLHQIYRYKSYLESKDNTLTRISGSGTDSAHSKKKLNNSAGTDYVHLAPCVVLFSSVSCSVGAGNHQSNAPWQTLHGPSRWGTHLTKMLNMGLLLKKTLGWKYYMVDIHYIKAKHNAPPI